MTLASKSGGMEEVSSFQTWPFRVWMLNLRRVITFCWQYLPLRIHNFYIWAGFSASPKQWYPTGPLASYWWVNQNFPPTMWTLATAAGALLFLCGGPRGFGATRGTHFNLRTAEEFWMNDWSYCWWFRNLVPGQHGLKLPGPARDMISAPYIGES